GMTKGSKDEIASSTNNDGGLAMTAFEFFQDSQPHLLCGHDVSFYGIYLFDKLFGGFIGLDIFF
ncbi:MAG: hypothetical protein WA162_01830, partial [Thermodesulfobacteriota bacterium]